MKPTTVLTSSGLKRARHRIGARFQRLLIDAVMRIGRQRAALAGLEIHDVVADACRGLSDSAASRASSSSARSMPKLVLAASRAGDRLEHQIDRRALADQLERAS